MKPTNFEKSFLLCLCAHCVVSSDTAVQVVLSVSFFLALHRKYLRGFLWLQIAVRILRYLVHLLRQLSRAVHPALSLVPILAY